MRRFSLILSVLLAFPQCSFAEKINFKTLSTPRFTLHIEDSKKAEHRKLSADELSRLAFNLLDQTYEEISRILKSQPKEKIVLRFMSPSEFRKQTGAPSWTNAMFLKGEITMPIDTSKAINVSDFKEALRHEFTHAVLAEASGYRIPAWLDEGIAQIIEGEINPVLTPALKSLINSKRSISFKKLQFGFTNLDSSMVPAAYAQSLFASKTLINRYGFKGVNTYLAFLKKGADDERAFMQAFRTSKSAFEYEIQAQLRRWAKSKTTSI